MSYVQQVIKATGGHAAPAENLKEDEEGYSDFILEFDADDLQYLAEVGEDYEDMGEEKEEEGRPPAPSGYHYMPDGRLMRDDEHSVRESLAATGYLIPEEQDLADALLEIVEKHGKFNADNTGVWAGYNSAEENADNAVIGVKCGNCVFWEGPNGCKITVNETEEGGLCRFAILPDNTVTAAAGSKPAPKKDQIKGSSKNAKGSASSSGTVNFSDKVVKALQNKADEHNEKHGDTASKKTSVRTLKAVYRRGAGAFSTGYRPGQNRNSWAMARVNAFLHLLRTGSPKNSKYVTDNDLLPAAHKRSSKKSAAITASADPCWEGYVQLGMKMKRGELVPNCVPIKAAQNLELIQSALSSDDLEEVLTMYNSAVGGYRRVALTSAAEVAARSFVEYKDAYEGEELTEAVLWELHSYLEYATLGVEDDADIVAAHSDLLTEGHPTQAVTASLEARINWAAAAPELEEDSREAVKAALSLDADTIEALHATSRVKALVSSGKLSAHTAALVNSLMSN
jgi:hypothetical protein